MQTIGIIGLGPIGMHFTRLLLEGGYRVVARDVDGPRAKQAATLRASIAPTTTEVARESDCVLLALPGDGAVRAVMEGEGLLDSLRHGQLCIDTGTSSPGLDRALAAACRERGVDFLEAPVTWRAPGLILMPAGDREAFERAEPILRQISYKYRYMGPSGRGQELKSVNQAYFSGRTAVAAECAAYARQLGFDRETIREFMELDFDDRLFGDQFDRVSGTVELNYKDLLYALDIAHERGIALPITSAVHGAFQYLTFHGGAKLDQNAIVRYWRALGREENA